MAVKDWSTTASSNTSVGGVNIAENAPRAGMNNAMRAIMADAKAKFDEIKHVSDFGVVGDGTTDDTAALQDAFDYASGNAPYGRTIIMAAGLRLGLSVVCHLALVSVSDNAYL